MGPGHARHVIHSSLPPYSSFRGASSSCIFPFPSQPPLPRSPRNLLYPVPAVSRTNLPVSGCTLHVLHVVSLTPILPSHCCLLPRCTALLPDLRRRLHLGAALSCQLGPCQYALRSVGKQRFGWWWETSRQSEWAPSVHKQRRMPCGQRWLQTAFTPGLLQPGWAAGPLIQASSRSTASSACARLRPWKRSCAAFSALAASASGAPATSATC